MGQTGVGKSTLLNRIAPELKLETGEISDSLGRGRHTTRAVSLYDVHGGKIADTPGFSSLDYEVDNAEDLSESFPEIRQASHGCKFRSCTHTHEPSCAVKDEVENMFTLILWTVSLFLILVGEQMWLLVCVNTAS